MFDFSHAPMSTVAVISCSTRKLLSRRLVEQLRIYHQTFAEFLASAPAELAMEQARPLYEGCTKARCESQEHEKLHGCYSEIHIDREAPLTEGGDIHESGESSQFPASQRTGWDAFFWRAEIPPIG
jgi:hypothetical protein